MAAGGPTPGVTQHRFFVAPEAVQNGIVTFSGEQARQLQRVLRLGAGDHVVALDGSGQEYVVRLEPAGKAVRGLIESSRENQAEPRTPVTLYQGLIKGPKLEMILQKGTELGLVGFVPVVTARAVAQEPGAAKQRRFEAIVREAAEQSERGRIPPLAAPEPYAAAVRQASDKGMVVLCWEDETARHLRDVSPVPGRPVALFTGPEGGFTPDEVALAVEAGAVIVTLGARILRAETAAIAASALLLARLGEVG